MACSSVAEDASSKTGASASSTTTSNIGTETSSPLGLPTSANATTEPIASSAFCSLASDAVRGQFDFTNESSVLELSNDPSLTEHQRVLMMGATSDAVRQIKAGAGYSNDLLVIAVNQICGLHLTPVTMVE